MGCFFQLQPYTTISDTLVQLQNDTKYHDKESTILTTNFIKINECSVFVIQDSTKNNTIYKYKLLANVITHKQLIYTIRQNNHHVMLYTLEKTNQKLYTRKTLLLLEYICAQYFSTQ